VSEVGMPPNKAMLTEDQIRLVADYIRTKRKP
jgi:hypothetical protein